MTAAIQEVTGLPDMKVSVRQVFGIDSDMEVPAYSQADEHVPDLDSDYRFDRPTTLAILAGFAKNRRVMVTGYHGTGKSTHIEQVAARLNWPCVRVNLDGHVSRMDVARLDRGCWDVRRRVAGHERQCHGDHGRHGVPICPALAASNTASLLGQRCQPIPVGLGDVLLAALL